ncbi:MAG: patatin-like phospholipase family protein [Acidimicrobiales bacterium]
MTDTPSAQPTVGDKVAIVLSGAGSRGAYEAGALSVLLPLLTGNDTPRIILGTSVGALNAAMLATVIDKGVASAAREIEENWEKVRPEKVFRIPWKGALTELAHHVCPQPGRAVGLVDTTPLQETIEELIQPNDYGHNTKAPHLDTVGIVASACSSRRAVVFVEGGPTPMSSSGDQVQYVQTTLGIPHLLASSAFPIVFPPQWVTDRTIDDDWYVDGGVQLNTAFKPAIDLGADKVLVVGGTPLSTRTGASATDLPTLGDSNGQILHALLANGIAPDIAHLSLTNQYLRALGSSPPSRASAPSGPPRRPRRLVSYFTVHPKNDCLDEEARKIYPAGLKSFLESFGGYKVLGSITCQKQWPGQFLSYMCFHPKFIRTAFEMGKEETVATLNGATSIPWITP